MTPLLTKKEFIDRTKHSNIFKMRGSISAIDQALDIWHKNRTLDNTVLVYKECRHWTKAKAGKTTETSLKRQTQVKFLTNDALNWIWHLDPQLGKARLAFENKKRLATAAPLQTQAMPGVYHHERALYEQSGKTRAPSATLLDGRYDPASNNNTEFSNLSEADFKGLDESLGKQFSVVYLKKMERLRDLMVVENHRLLKADGQPLTTTGLAGWPYAIDAYGNLFTKNDQALNLHAKCMFNHSSFNAGNDVVCAGMICVNNGMLQRISNNSGHYKPSRRNLFNAAQALIQELGAAGAAGALVEFWSFHEAGFINIYDFPIAAFQAAGGLPANPVMRMAAH